MIADAALKKYASAGAQTSAKANAREDRMSPEVPCRPLAEAVALASAATHTEPLRLAAQIAVQAQAVLAVRVQAVLAEFDRGS